MQRRIYLSCGPDEQELPLVLTVRQFLASTGAKVDFQPDLRSRRGYVLMERAIEQCDTFLAVFAAISSVSTAFAHAALYAFELNRHRMAPRPRLFGIRVDPWRVPKAVEQIPFEWVSEGSCENLLYDSPPE